MQETPPTTAVQEAGEAAIRILRARHPRAALVMIAVPNEPGETAPEITTNLATLREILALLDTAAADLRETLARAETPEGQRRLSALGDEEALLARLVLGKVQMMRCEHLTDEAIRLGQYLALELESPAGSPGLYACCEACAAHMRALACVPSA